MSIDVDGIIESLRNAEEHNIALPKSVAVGLLVGIQDALKDVEYLAARAKTKKDKTTLSLMNYHLEGPRDRLLRVIQKNAS